MWPISDRAHDIELLRQYHRIAHIICQRFQTNPDEGGRRTAKRILSDGYSGLCHNSNTHHNIYKRISLIAHPDKNVTRDTFHCALAHLVMESIQKAFDITTSLTTNADSRQAFQLIPTLDSERFRTLVHSYRRPTLTRSVSDPSIKTINKSDNTLTETPTRHNAVSSPLRRFATMPPPSTTGCTPLTPGPNTYAINSLRRTFNPISATNLFPDETPDTDRAGSTTEPAYFSDIDEDDPSPHDDEPPSMDDDVPVIRVATDSGGVDTGHTAPAPPTDTTIGDTNNPTGAHGVMPTGPDGDTHVVNSNTAASPIFGDTTAAIQPNPEPTQRSVHTVSTHTTNDGASAITMDVGPHDDISTFLLHIRRAADDAASSLSHNVIVNPADGDKATAASAIDTGNVDTGGRASTPPTDMTIDSTNNPTGLDGTIPTGPNDDIHVANATDPVGAPQPEPPANDNVATWTPTDTSTTTVHGKKRHRKRSHKAQDSRKHHRRMSRLHHHA